MSAPTRDAVAALLRAVWQTDVGVDGLHRIEPWFVVRAEVRAVGRPRTVIIKWVRDGDPNDPGARARPEQASAEAITLSFLAERGVRAPELITTGGGLVIMEDLVEHRPLDRLIHEAGDGDEVRAHLRRTARLLADRHARTVGHADAYYERFAGATAVDPVSERRRFMAAGWHNISRHATAIGCPPGDAAAAEAHHVWAILDRPGALMALSNGDSATNNVLVGESDAVIIDYEFAGYRHCLSDLPDFYLPGPRWVTVADAVETGFEDAYRSALAPTIPEIGDDARFGRDLAAAGLTHAFTRLGNLPKMDARPAGDRSRLERMITVEAAVDLAESRQCFPALVAWLRALGRTLRTRWPEVDVRTDRLPRFLSR